jgi:chromosome partitioning protein
VSQMAATAMKTEIASSGAIHPNERTHVIAFGNEKGGTGKTTTAVHVAIALLRSGARVAAIDLDARQRTFARYIENRAAFSERCDQAFQVPKVFVIERSTAPNIEAAVAQEAERLNDALHEAAKDADFVVIDMPGNDTNLSRLGHAFADTLVTPMNDSFLDFDLLAKVNSETLEILAPSLYAEFVWECRKRRVLSRRPAIDWVVMRNRISSVEARNKRRVAGALDSLSERIGFRIAPGLSERVIFRELFPMGLTLLDLPAPGVEVALTMSHVSARQELRDLMSVLSLPGVKTVEGRPNSGAGTPKE